MAAQIKIDIWASPIDNWANLHLGYNIYIEKGCLYTEKNLYKIDCITANQTYLLYLCIT